MSKMTNLTQDEPCRDVDGVLREFFEGEMPKPWPAFRAPNQTTVQRSAPAWTRHAGRLALAACVAMLVAGYLTLAGFFPTGTPQSGVTDQARPIGSIDKKGKAPDNQADEPMLPLDNEGHRPAPR